MPPPPISVFLVMLVFAGCASDPDWNGTPTACEGESATRCVEETIEVRGVQRTFLVTGDLEADCEAPLPLVLAFHGSDTNAEYLRRRFELPTIAGTATLVVYPDGLPRPERSDRLGWELDAGGEDLEFVDELVVALAATHCADPDRVFAVGHSRGGRFIEVLACNRSDAHRAFASISAGANNVESCPDQAPIWITHSRRDKEVGFRNGVRNARHWAERNGCDTTRRLRGVPDDVCTELTGCAESVVWCPTTSTVERGHGVSPNGESQIEAFFTRFL